MPSAPQESVFFESRKAAPVAAEFEPGGRAAIRRRRNLWFAVSALLLALGIWGLIAWRTGWPVGGEIRADPFDQNQWRLGNLVELATTTVPHRALRNMPVVPAGTLGLLSLRPLPDDFVQSPYAALAPIRASAGPPEERPGFQEGQSNAPPIQQFNAPPAAEPDKLDLSKEPIANAPAEFTKGDILEPPESAPGQEDLGGPEAFDVPQQDLPLDAAAAAELRAAVLKVGGYFQAIGLDGAAFETFDSGESWFVLPLPDGTQEVASLPVADSTWLSLASRSYDASQAWVRLDAAEPSGQADLRYEPVVQYTAQGEFAAVRVSRAALAAEPAAFDVGIIDIGKETPILFPDGFVVSHGLLGRRDEDAVSFNVLVSGRDARNRRLLWAGGEAGTIVRLTLAAPETGNPINDFTGRGFATPTAAPIRSIFFASADFGWASSGWGDGNEENTDRPVVLQTRDGGDSWDRLRYRHFPAPWVYAAFFLALVPFAFGTRAHLQYLRTAERPRIAEHGVSDNPIGLDDADALGLVPIARAMSRFIRNVQTRPTVAIGVTGQWGSGKSSLMNLVKEDLGDRGIRTVWFNAWHHQKEDSLLAALLMAIRSQAVPHIWTPSGLWFRVRLAYGRIGRDVAQVLAIVGLLFVAGYLFVRFGGDAIGHIKGALSWIAGFFKTGSTESGPETFGQFVEALLTTSGGAAGALGLAIAAARFVSSFRPLRASPADLMATFAERSSAKNFDQQLSFRHRFTGEFRLFCKTLRTRTHPGLVIFIDDLDRCASRQTVDVLESINFVTTAGPCFVVLGFDEAKVKAAVADVYKDTLLELDEAAAGAIEKPKKDDLFNFATRYLEKLVQLVVPVPAGADDTVEKILGLKPVLQPSRWRRRLSKAPRRCMDILGIIFIGVLAGLTLWYAVDLAGRGFATWQASFATEKASDAGATPETSAASDTADGTPATPGETSPPSAEASPTADAQPESLPVDPLDLVALPPWAPPLAALVLVGLVASIYVPRFFSEPVVDDSASFREALEIWAPVIARQRQTPRAVKRFVNRLRFLAMRIRDIGEEAVAQGRDAPIDEPTLVTFAAIEEVDDDRFGRPMNGSGSTDGDIDSAVLGGLDDFARRFGRRPDDNGDALRAYRAIAGIVEERSGEARPESKPDSKPQDRPLARKPARKSRRVSPEPRVPRGDR
jgi:hypothetical protein